MIAIAFLGTAVFVQHLRLSYDLLHAGDEVALVGVTVGVVIEVKTITGLQLPGTTGTDQLLLAGIVGVLPDSGLLL